MERPILRLDLQGPEGNVFVVIGRVRELLTGLMLEHFNTESIARSMDYTQSSVCPTVGRKSI